MAWVEASLAAVEAALLAVLEAEAAVEELVLGAGGQGQGGGQTDSCQKAAAGDLLHIHTLLLDLQ